jgi:DNA-binding NtrC family response regulator
VPKILVVDDDAAVRETITFVLERNGFVVVQAKDGFQGIAAIGSERPDLVITDIVMPNKDGIETIREIRHHYPDLNIVAISGGGKIDGAFLLSMAHKLGAVEILPKPFLPHELLEIVERCLVSA